MTSELKVDKITPASGTSGTIGDSGDTFTVPSGATLTASAATVNLPTSIITGQSEKTSLVDTDKFLISDSAASGAFKFVQNSKLQVMKETGSLYFETTTSANTMNIDSCFSSAYNMYLVKFQVLPSSNAVGLTMRARNASGSLSGSHYDYASRYFNSAGSSGSHTGTEQNKIVLSTSVTSREYDTGAWGELFIWCNTDRSASAAFSCTGRYGVMSSNSGGQTFAYYHASQFQQTVTDAGALTGLQMYWESGNTEQANIKVYGLLGSNA